MTSNTGSKLWQQLEMIAQQPRAGQAFLALNLLLLALCIPLYKGRMSLEPTGIHAWGQADRYTVGLAYAHQTLNPLLPRTYNLCTREGICGMEFPTLALLSGMLMRIAGSDSPFWMRGLCLFISLLGLNGLFYTGFRLSRSYWLAALPVLYVFLWPIYQYYQAGFMPDAVAFSLFSLALAAQAHLQQKPKAWLQVLKYSLLLLAILTKYYMVACVAAFAAYELLLVWDRRPPLHWWLVWLSILGCWLAYIYYSRWLNTYTRIYPDIMPVFVARFLPADSLPALLDTMVRTFRNWKADFLAPAHNVLLVFALLGGMRQVFKGHAPSRWGFLFLCSAMLGMLALALMMAINMPDHDYYQISLSLPLLAACVVWGTAAARPWKTGQQAALVLVFLCAALPYSLERQNWRYHDPYMDFYSGAAQDLKPYRKRLNDWGMKPDEQIMVAPAVTPNLELLVLGRRGLAFHYVGDSILYRVRHWQTDIRWLLMPKAPQTDEARRLHEDEYFRRHFVLAKEDEKVALYRRRSDPVSVPEQPRPDMH